MDVRRGATDAFSGFAGRGRVDCTGTSPARVIRAVIRQPAMSRGASTGGGSSPISTLLAPPRPRLPYRSDACVARKTPLTPAAPAAPSPTIAWERGPGVRRPWPAAPVQAGMCGNDVGFPAVAGRTGHARVTPTGDDRGRWGRWPLGRRPSATHPTRGGAPCALPLRADRCGSATRGVLGASRPPHPASLRAAPRPRSPCRGGARVARPRRKARGSTGHDTAPG